MYAIYVDLLQNVSVKKIQATNTTAASDIWRGFYKKEMSLPNGSDNRNFVISLDNAHHFH